MPGCLTGIREKNKDFGTRITRQVIVETFGESINQVRKFYSDRVKVTLGLVSLCWRPGFPYA